MKRFKFKISLLILILLMLNINISTLKSQVDIYSYPDQNPCNFFPKNPDEYSNTCTGKGLWHGYTLPNINDTQHLGQFGGPFCYFTNKWISESLLKTGLSVAGIGEIELAAADEITISQYPTHLIQNFIFKDFSFECKLSYVSERSSILEVFAINKSENDQKFNISVSGDLYNEVATAEKFTDGWMIKSKVNENVIWLLRIKVQGELDFAYNNLNYNLSYKSLQPVAPNDTLSLVLAISQYFIGDNQKDIEITNNALIDPNSFFQKNINWWNFIYSNLKHNNKEYLKVSAKAFQTIMLNMRSNLPGFTHYAFQSGMNKQNYINTDESWIISSAIVMYDTKLSLHNFLATALRHNSDGSLNKFLPLSDTTQTNTEIYEKPLMVWTLWNAFSLNPQPDIVNNTIQILEKCHNYWYEYRDIDKNGFCEDIQGFENVTLNAMLFNEKHYLKKIYQYLHDSQNEKKYEDEINNIVKTFNYKFFNTNDANYYDYNPADSMWYAPQEEVVGYVLWAGLASWDIARIIVENNIRKKIESGYYKNININRINDPAYFFFLIKGLSSYGFNEEAENIKKDIKDCVAKTFSNSPIDYYLDYKNNIKIKNSSYLAACILIYLNYL